MSLVETLLAEVDRAHFRRNHLTTICMCGQDVVDMSQHRAAEQAKALRTAGLLAPEVLRAAADDLRDEWAKRGKHYGLPGCYSSGYEKWLRSRADLLGGAR